jgi:chromate transporter
MRSSSCSGLKGSSNKSNTGGRTPVRLPVRLRGGITVTVANHDITFREALKVWIKVGLLSFGGPAAQIAVMHRIIVEEKRWVSERRFLHALNYCMLLPGPEAQQLATYLGWLLHRTWGGIVAGSLFVLPGFLSILALSIFYAAFLDTGWVDALFYGLKPAVLAIVVVAVIRIGKRALANAPMALIAAGAFVAMFFFAVPFPIVIVSAGAIGYLGYRTWGDAFNVVHREHAGPDGMEPQWRLAEDSTHQPPSAGYVARTAALWLALWALPFVLIGAIADIDSIYFQEALFFSKVAVVTFGGAYAVLGYVAQQAVETMGWITPGQMLDGLGMAETTPGPLIQVVQFVGFMGAHDRPGEMYPMTAGILASVLVTWVTFIPCFLFIFVGAPFIEHLRGRRGLTAALSGITAAVVGVILNLALWFALHTMFAEVVRKQFGPLSVLVPSWREIDGMALAITMASFLLMFRYRWGMIPTIGASVAAGVAWWAIMRA